MSSKSERLAGRQPPPIPPEQRKHTGRPIVPLIQVPSEHLGPAMLALTNGAQRAFVVAKVFHGLSNRKAAQAAGYSAASPAALDAVGSRLAHDERIQAAILEEGSKLMRTEGPKSIHTIVAIRDDKTLDAKDRLKAAVELLNRSGFQATTSHTLTVEHTLTDGQKDARIIELCRELGLPETEARKMLIAPDKIQDAEFVEVEPIAPDVAAKRAHRNERRRNLDALPPDEREARKAQTKENHRIAMKERRRLAEETRKTNSQLEKETAQETEGETIQW